MFFSYFIYFSFQPINSMLLLFYSSLIILLVCNGWQYIHFSIQIPEAKCAPIASYILHLMHPIPSIWLSSSKSMVHIISIFNNTLWIAR